MLVGREAESATLAAGLEAGRAGTGGAFLLVGEPGIGKTTLLRRLVEQAGAAVVLEAQGVESESDLPYAALGDLLTPVLHLLDGLPAQQAAALTSALALGAPGPVDRFAVAAAMLTLLSLAAEDQPVVVAVDDLQWVDSGSRDALAFATRRLRSLPVVLVASQRTSQAEVEAALPGAEVIQLEPLGPEDARRVLGATEAMAPEVVARLLDAARGNPLALVELPRLLTPGQLSGTTPLADPIPTKNGLERAFAAQLGPLSEGGRQAVLTAAADSSRGVGVVLAALESLGLSDVTLREVEALGLIAIDANRLEFRHPLVRSAAYHGAGPAERRLVHAALAEADDDPDRRAWHVAAAALAPEEDIAAELDRAGERALARGAFGAAAAALERAAALTPDRETRGLRLLRSASALEVVGSAVRSEAAARQAADLVEEPRARARIVLQLATLKLSSGEAEIGYSMLLEEAERLSEVDAEFAAAMLSVAANLPLFRLQAATTVALAERASALGDPDRPRMLAERAALGVARVMAGDPAGKALLLELARESSSDVGTGHRQSSVAGWGLVWLEEYEAARTLLAWAVEVQRGGGALRYLPQSLHPLAELDFRVGRWLPALAEARQAIALFEETGQRIDRGFACATCARIEAALGRDDECRGHASEAFAADTTAGLRMASAYAAAATGLLDLGRGDPEGAIAALEPVAETMREGEVAEPWIVQWAPDLVEAYIHAGKVDRAAETLAGLESQAHATGRISALAAAARCRGILGDDASFAEALTLHDLVPTPFERGRTELAYGERLRRTGHRAEARERLNRALHVFERLGAEPWAERTRVELRASGKTVRTPTQRIDEELTPQELQVAALVADGATNREAAASLFLSGKTIEFHLRNVYRKLGIRSRTELARVMSAPAGLADTGAQL